MMEVSRRNIGIVALPNEILISILSQFPTNSLLPLTSTSKAIHSLILRIITHRLQITSCLPSHELIFECFHPAFRMATPYFLCEYLDTKPLCPTPQIKSTPSLGGLRDLYTSFRPYPPLKPSSSRTHPAGGPLPINQAINTTATDSTPGDEKNLITQNIFLESHELFSQLCTLTNLVKVGPKRGLFVSCVGVGEGIIRVWRNWLSERATECEATPNAGKNIGKEGILWADSKEHVGLRVNVREVRDGSVSVVETSRKDEDEAVTYVLEYEELLVRTSRLLLKVEQSIDQEVNHTGKATVIGSWDR